MKRFARRSALGAGILLVLIQTVPYGRDHSNPPVTGTPRWDSPKTEELATRACFDCHSHATRWPWYSRIAPASWLVQKDVDEARGELNFSACDRPQEAADEAARMVRRGKMPPRQYLLLHPEARLSEAEKADLVRGLTATFGSGEPDHHAGETPHHDEDDD